MIGDVDDTINSVLPFLDCNSSRKLTITTWGTEQSGVRGHPPKESQYNVNASVLVSCKKGLNLKQMDGRDRQIQRRICRASTFDTLLRSTVKNIEKKELTNISVNCSKGRHRSVAFAEILKQYYYPMSTTHHPNLKK